MTQIRHCFSTRSARSVTKLAARMQVVCFFLVVIGCRGTIENGPNTDLRDSESRPHAGVGNPAKEPVAGRLVDSTDAGVPNEIPPDGVRGNTGDGGTLVAPADGGVGGRLGDAATVSVKEPDRTDGIANATILPVIWLETKDQKVPARDPKTPGRLKLFDKYSGTADNVMGLEAQTPTLDVPIAIGIRGGFTASLPKLPYGVELQDGAGNDKAFSLLGMPKGSDWVLYACYTDKTCMRNAMVYAVGQDLGRYSPRFRFVEVIINGKYVGLYNLIEKIRRDNDRVDVPKPAATAADGELSGGYIIKHEGGSSQSPPNNFKTNDGTATGLAWTHYYPKSDTITAAQRAYITTHFEAFQKMMLGPDWTDATKGYPAWIDVGSFVDIAIMNEVTNNWDGYSRSSFFTKLPANQGNKLVAGPLWDFDLAFGNISMGDSFKTDTWSYIKDFHPAPQNKAPFLTPFFWMKLWKEPTFTKQMRCRWQTLRMGPLSLDTIDRRLGAWRTYLLPVIARDQKVWPTLGKKIFPNYFVGKTFDEEINWLRDWIAKRLDFLDKNLPGTCL